MKSNVTEGRILILKGQKREQDQSDFVANNFVIEPRRMGSIFVQLETIILLFITNKLT